MVLVHLDESDKRVCVCVCYSVSLEEGLVYGSITKVVIDVCG